MAKKILSNIPKSWTHADVEMVRDIDNIDIRRGLHELNVKEGRKTKRKTKAGRKMTTPKRIRVGGGAAAVMELMSIPQASKAATTKGRLPKKLQGKVKGANRKG